MGIAILSFNALFAPLQAAVDWLAGKSAAPVSIAPGARPVCAGGQFGLQRPGARPLRVLRVIEGPRAVAGAGRMVISGRMADVCAELERLAALEAAGR